jgi:hypothetical protein
MGDMRISIMQPYFLPYAGYFRLMCGVDAFVVLDDVQFPRGGWVHRNRLKRDDGRLGWLTLPLQKQSLASTIGQMRLHADAFGGEWARRVRGFAAGRWAQSQSGPIGELVRLDADGLAQNLRRSLQTCRDMLGFETAFVAAADVACDPGLTGRARVIEICRRLGATRYVNAPGGRSLYDAAEFARCGITLEFLPDYRGDTSSILQRLFEMPAPAIRDEILANMA